MLRNCQISVPSKYKVWETMLTPKLLGKMVKLSTDVQLPPSYLLLKVTERTKAV